MDFLHRVVKKVVELRLSHGMHDADAMGMARHPSRSMKGERIVDVAHPEA